MNMNIIVNEFFEKSNWFKEFFDEIKKIAAKKHIRINIYDSADKISDVADVVLLAGGSESWVNTVSANAVSKGLRCVVVGSESAVRNCSYIGIDYENSSIAVLEYMKQCGCKKIAYCGYNSDAGSDRKKLAGYKKLFSEGDVFENNGDAGRCCSEFVKNIHRFDGVLCANDQIAALVAMDAKKTDSFCSDRFKIASFGNTQILRRVYPGVLQISLDMKSAASHAAEVYTYLCENKSVLKMSVNTKNCIFDGDAEIDYPILPISYSKYEDEVNFYGDKAVEPIVRFENLLSHMDVLDEKILYAVSSGMTYEKIEEQYNVSVTSVKYRIKKLITICGVKNRTELIAEVKKFM